MNTPDLLKVSKTDLIAKITQSHPEMLWLTGKVASSPEINTKDKAKTIGEQLFPKLKRDQLIEFDRTAAGILVLKWIFEDDYENFTACQQQENKLDRASFNHLRSFTLSVLHDEEAVTAMITFMVINDLTKIKLIVAEIEKRLDIKEIDHDILLFHALKRQPIISPSFMRLPNKYRQLIIESLSAKFNIGQLMQGENVAASLKGLHGLGKDALDFYLLHAICDIGGAGGQFSQNGSLILTQPTYTNFRMAIQALQGFKNGNSIDSIYENYFLQKAQLFDHNFSTKEDKALARLACLFRLEQKKNFAILKSTFNALDNQKKELLTNELTKKGIEDGIAILIYYAPALLHNIVKKKKEDTAFELGLNILHKIYKESREKLNGRADNGIFTVMATSLAELVVSNPKKLYTVDFSLEMKGKDAEIKIK